MLAVSTAVVVVVAAAVGRAVGHGFMVVPPQRGALNTQFNFPKFDESAPIDYWYAMAPVAGGRVGAGGREHAWVTDGHSQRARRLFCFRDT